VENSESGILDAYIEIDIVDVESGGNPAVL
jgi:hypothetical protein